MYVDGTYGRFSNIRYMEWKEDYAACQHAEVALRTQAAECSSAEGTSHKRHSDVEEFRQLGVLLVFLGDWIWSSVLLV